MFVKQIKILHLILYTSICNCLFQGGRYKVNLRLTGQNWSLNIRSLSPIRVQTSRNSSNKHTVSHRKPNSSTENHERTKSGLLKCKAWRIRILCKKEVCIIMLNFISTTSHVQQIFVSYFYLETLFFSLGYDCDQESYQHI